MKYLSILFAFVICISCSKDDIGFKAENDKEIRAYLAKYNLNAQRSSSGLYHIIEEQGTGIKPTKTDRVKVIYKAYYTNGDFFEQSGDDGLSFNLQYVINGWKEGLLHFSEGSKGKLFIPAHLGHDNGYSRIGEVLIYDIEMLYVNYEKENDDQIQTYLSENDLEAEKTNSGLYYTIHETGSGNTPNTTDNITVTYKGYFIDGTVFDEATEPVMFNLEQVLKGFSEGLTHFKEGGTGTLYIPSQLAHGDSGSLEIRGGSVLIFDINLISIN